MEMGTEEEAVIKVREIMSHPIITGDEDALVSEIVKDMADLDIGSVVITSEGKPVGIITERDIALKVLLKDKRASEVKAKEIMSSPLVTIEPEASIDEASELAATEWIKRLPVVENGVLVGIVSIRNILTRKPEYVKRFYPEVRLLASGWTLDRLEKSLSDCELSLVGKHIQNFRKTLDEVYNELVDLVNQYVDDKELRDIFESLKQFYQEIEDKGVCETARECAEQRKKLDEIVRKFRHTTFLRKQQSISSFSEGSWLGSYRYRAGKEYRLPFKRTRP